MVLLLDYVVTSFSCADVPVSVHQFLGVLPIEAEGIYYPLVGLSIGFLEREGLLVYPVWRLW